MMRRHARAVTLVECLAAIGVMSTVLSLVGVLYGRIVRASAAMNGYEARMASARFLLDRVSAETRAARGFLETDGQRKAGPGCLILAGAEGPVTLVAKDGQVVQIEQGAESVLLSGQDMNVSFALEGAPAAARSVVVTVKWEEPLEMGVRNPVLSLRLTPRNRSVDEEGKR